MERILTLRLVKLSEADILNYTKGIRKKHKHARPFECPICSKRFSFTWNLSQHSAAHVIQKTICSYCGADNLKETTWKQHSKSKLLKTPKTCASCPQIFHRQACYLTHLKIHGIPCRFCGKKFQKLFKLKVHEEKCETGDFGVKCTLCDKVFHFQSHLEEHTRIHHTNEKPFKCDKCDYRCKIKRLLYRHSSINHDPNRQRKFQCNECPKSFYGKGPLNTHFKIFHTGDKKEPHICLICGETFTFVEDYSKHKKTHKVFSCPKCDRKYTNYNSIRGHLATVHTVERLLTCPMGCGSTFKSQFNLKSHIKAHTGEKPHNCQFCDKTFSRSENLKNHLLTHTGEQPFKCTHCSKKFVDKRNYMLHLKIHEENRDVFSCPNCEQEYFNKVNWMSHMNEEELESPLICNGCGNHFYKKACFRNHLKIKKHIVRCESCNKPFKQFWDFEKHKKEHENENGRIGPL